MPIKACFALAVLFATSGFVFSGQAPTAPRNRVDDYNIRGKIVLPNNRDLDQRIEVHLEKSEFQVIQTTYSDAAGNFGFNNLAPGAYYVSISLEGYDPVRQSVEIFNSFGHATVTIFPTKPAVIFRDR